MNTAGKQSLTCFSSFIIISGPFHSPSDVLLIFRSRYWFAIGLHVIFILRRCLPPVQTPFPRSPTLAKRPVPPAACGWDRNITFCVRPFQSSYSHKLPNRARSYRGHAAESTWTRRFTLGIYSLRSPLLRVSRLFSFPGLIDMLKFSPYCFSIQGKKVKGGVLFEWG